MAKELYGPKLEEWALAAKEYWKKNDPELYAQLQKSGKLNQSLYRAQENAKDLYYRLMLDGMDPDEAKEQALQQWIYVTVDEKDPNPELEQEQGEANQVEAFEAWLRAEDRSVKPPPLHPAPPPKSSGLPKLPGTSGPTSG